MLLLICLVVNNTVRRPKPQLNKLLFQNKINLGGQEIGKSMFESY